MHCLSFPTWLISHSITSYWFIQDVANVGFPSFSCVLHAAESASVPVLPSAALLSSCPLLWYLLQSQFISPLVSLFLAAFYSQHYRLSQRNLLSHCARSRTGSILSSLPSGLTCFRTHSFIFLGSRMCTELSSTTIRQVNQSFPISLLHCPPFTSVHSCWDHEDDPGLFSRDTPLLSVSSHFSHGCPAEP